MATENADWNFSKIGPLVELGPLYTVNISESALKKLVVPYS